MSPNYATYYLNYYPGIFSASLCNRQTRTRIA